MRLYKYTSSPLHGEQRCIAMGIEVQKQFSELSPDAIFEKLKTVDGAEKALDLLSKVPMENGVIFEAISKKLQELKEKTDGTAESFPDEVKQIHENLLALKKRIGESIDAKKSAMLDKLIALTNMGALAAMKSILPSKETVDKMKRWAIIGALGTGVAVAGLWIGKKILHGLGFMKNTYDTGKNAAKKAFTWTWKHTLGAALAIVGVGVGVGAWKIGGHLEKMDALAGGGKKFAKGVKEGAGAVAGAVVEGASKGVEVARNVAEDPVAFARKIADQERFKRRKEQIEEGTDLAAGRAKVLMEKAKSGEITASADMLLIKVLSRRLCENSMNIANAYITLQHSECTVEKILKCFDDDEEGKIMDEDKFWNLGILNKNEENSQELVHAVKLIVQDCAEKFSHAEDFVSKDITRENIESMPVCQFIKLYTGGQVLPFMRKAMDAINNLHDLDPEKVVTAYINQPRDSTFAGGAFSNEYLQEVDIPQEAIDSGVFDGVTMMGITRAFAGQSSLILAGWGDKVSKKETQDDYISGLEDEWGTQKDMEKELVQVSAEFDALDNKTKEIERIKSKEDEEMDRLAVRKVELKSHILQIKALKCAFLLAEYAFPNAKKRKLFYHETLPDTVWLKEKGTDTSYQAIQNSRKNLDVIEGHKDNMALPEILRYVLWDRMMRSKVGEEQVTGLLGMQTEVFNYIRTKDKGILPEIELPDWAEEARPRPKKIQAMEGLLAKLANPGDFIDEIKEATGIDEETIQKALMNLEGPAKKTAGVSAVGLLLPLRTIMELAVATGRRSGNWEPAFWVGGSIAVLGGAPIIAGIYGTKKTYQFAKFLAFRNTPENVLARLGKIGEGSLRRRIRSGVTGRPGLGYEAAQKARNRLGSISEKVNKIPDDVICNDLKSAYRKLNRGSFTDDALMAFKKAVDKAEIMAAGDPYLLQRVTEIQVEFRKGILGSKTVIGAARHTTRPIRSMVGSWLGVEKGNLRKTLPRVGGYVAGLALQGYVAYQDWNELIDMYFEEGPRVMAAADQTLDQLKSELASAVDERGKLAFEEIGGSYRHILTGHIIDLEIVESDLSDVGNLQSQRRALQWARAGTSSAAFLAMGVIGARAWMGPKGLIIAGVEIGIRTAIDTEEKADMRAFLRDSPLWVLSVMGTQESTRESEHVWFKRFDSMFTLTDLWPEGCTLTDAIKPRGFGGAVIDLVHGEKEKALKKVLPIAHIDTVIDRNKEKPLLAKRLLFTILTRDLISYAPRVRQALFNGSPTPEAVDTFFAGDFQQVFLPFFFLSLYRRKGKAPPDGCITEIQQGGFPGLPWGTSLLNIRVALRDAAVFALQHVQEKRYKEVLDLIKKAEESDDIDAMGTYGDIAEIMRNNVQIFGKSLEEVVDTSKKTTAANRILSELVAAKPGSSIFDAVLKENNLDTPDAVYTFVQDPTERLKLQHATAQTLDDEKVQKKELPLRKPKRFALFHEYEKSLDAQADSIYYSLSFAGADVIGSALMEEDYVELNQMDMIQAFTGTRSAEAAAAMTARELMTTYTVEYIEKQKKTAEYKRSAQLEKDLYGSLEHPPAVFLSRSYGMEKRGDPSDLISALSDPMRQFSSPPEGFSNEELQSVFFDVRHLSGSMWVVLATYVYGDLQSGNVRILRNSAVTASLVGLTKPSRAVGRIEPLSVEDFLQSPDEKAFDGKNVMLSMAEHATSAEGKNEWERKLEEDNERRHQVRQAMEIQEKQEAQEQSKIASDVFVDMHDGTYVTNTDTWKITWRPPKREGAVSSIGAVYEEKNYTEPDCRYTFHLKNVDTGEEREEIIHSIHDVEKTSLPSSVRDALLHAITTPRENDPEGAIGILFNLYAHTSTKPWFRTRIHHKEKLIQEILPLYKDTEAKQQFLQKIVERMNKNKDVIDSDAVSELRQYFESYRSVLQKKLSPLDRQRLKVGEEFLEGRRPDSDGVYRRRVGTAFYRFFPGEGWQWSRDREVWMTTSFTVVRDGAYKGRALGATDRDFIQKLDKAQGGVLEEKPVQKKSQDGSQLEPEHRTAA